MAIVHWTRAADSALNEIVRMRRRNAGIVSARRLYERIRAQTTRLANFPELGHRILDDPAASLRVLIVAEYRIAFRVEGDEIFIGFIAHGRSSLISANDDDEV
jgi:plasmid stabilization system protein ParE